MWRQISHFTPTASKTFLGRSLSQCHSVYRTVPWIPRLGVLTPCGASFGNQLRFATGHRSWRRKAKTKVSVASLLVIFGTGAVYLLPTRVDPEPEFIQKMRNPIAFSLGTFGSDKKERQKTNKDEDERNRDNENPEPKGTAWFNFTTRFEAFSNMAELEWATLSNKIVGYIVPEWSKSVPGQVRRLQRELSMAPGSLADEIWTEAHDPYRNPEIQYAAKVRVSPQLCDEEKEYLARRKKVTASALARYLGIDENVVHPDDVPTIALCGSGGGLRALTAGAGAMLATEEDGLFDCTTYTSGVSGSCWLQSLYNSSLTSGRFEGVIEHLKARVGVHMAYPPVAFNSVTTAPTNKYLLAGLVEKLRGDPKADIGLVDIYGILLAARLLVPKGELGVNEMDFKLSNQRSFLQYGQHPLPIYTTVRHEIPDINGSGTSHVQSVSEEAKAQAKKEAWFQWYEITPYEFFCEEFNAGIPTWALGRKFKDGSDVEPESGFHLPEMRIPFWMGVFGSAFCATLSHYYQEIRPLVRGLTGFGTLDDMVTQRSEDLSKVHPITPATIPNFAYGMKDKLPKTTPSSVVVSEYIQLMDAGMSNNLPIYPLLRPGRNVDVFIVFDTSADVKTDNWLSVTEGYARQRGVKGWPVGIGWPREDSSPSKVEQQLEQASVNSKKKAHDKVEAARTTQSNRRGKAGITEEEARQNKFVAGKPARGELGHCTVWVGSTEERSVEPPPPSKALDTDSTWRLMEPDAGIAVVYMPFIKNKKVPGVDPGSSEYLSTWNFVYTPEQIDKVVQLAKANYDEGKEQVRATIRAVYERKKKTREEREEKATQAKNRVNLRKGLTHSLGEGDHFS